MCGAPEKFPAVQPALAFSIAGITSFSSNSGVIGPTCL